MTSTEPLDRPSNYQARDIDIIDYQMTELPGTKHLIRGPIPDLDAGNQITFIGAAQSFGCYFEKCFANLVGQELDRPVLNLGFGGAGPGFFIDNPELIETANKGALTVVQIMSGRVQPNMFMEGKGLARVKMRRKDMNVHPHVAWADIAEGFYAWRRLPAPFKPAVRFAARAPLALALAQSRKGYVAAYQEMLRQITTPTILLWISQRTPEYPRKPIPTEDLMGDYPQLVSRDWITPIEGHANSYVEVVSSRGMPITLRDKKGDPITIDMGLDSALYEGVKISKDKYYPSEEMHADAADALIPVARKILA